jgi:hypothetical protein
LRLTQKKLLEGPGLLTVFLVHVLVHVHVRLHVPDQLVGDNLRSFRNVLDEFVHVAHLEEEKSGEKSMDQYLPKHFAIFWMDIRVERN